MMNIENMKKLIAQLERLPDEKFDMDCWVEHSGCGTIACIAGWCSLLNGGPVDQCIRSPVGAMAPQEAFARDFLDLDASEANELFLGEWDGAPAFPSRLDALDELKRMVAAA